jgi:hypothetical protein
MPTLQYCNVPGIGIFLASGGRRERGRSFSDMELESGGRRERGRSFSDMELEIA